MTETLTEQTIETRAGGAVAEVNFPKRIVTCVAMPYEHPAEIYDGRRSYTEIVSRTAFAGVERRSSQIRANRDHTWDKLCGKVVALHPSRKEGLVAEVRMFGTDIGERTLIECDEGGLDASAGFQLLCRDDGRVYQDAEVWERNRTVRRLNRLRLEHLAFVPNPAYEAATVLSVRHATSPQEPAGGERMSVSTPNLARFELDALRAAHEALNRKWAG